MNKRFFLSIGLLLSLISMSDKVKAQSAEATLEFVPSLTQVNSSQEFTVDVILKNPALQNIISVRSWLQYDAELLEGEKIDTDASLFTLAAPGENEFSAAEGLVKIGRSNISGGFNQAETKVATVHFKVKSSSKVSAQIEPYDYQTTELGHNSVNIIDQGFPVNILSMKPQPLSLMLNGALEIGGDSQVIPDSGQNVSNLSRPQNVKINTGSGYVDLKWDPINQPEVKGYNIYYGKTSGEYSRRRDIGLTGQYRLEGLNNDEVYYLALTAYNALNEESDYSDEVAIIVNQPLSSTSPFEASSSSALDMVPESPKNGPMIWWLAFSALGLGGVLAFRKRKFNDQFSNPQ